MFFIEQLILACNPYLVFICILGTILGLLWGSMPGISTTMSMVLLIGLSTQMSQDVAIMFLLGVYTASVFGGSITAVLINIPGTPAAVPTMIEGYQLAQRGEGGQALGTALVASFLGNWVGILILVAFIPLILLIALQFRSWEMFLLALWGIAICGTLTSGEAPIKGWISGWLGLLIAFVGLDNIYGVPRFTFGNVLLEDGISYIPVIIGFFGLTEVLWVLPQKEPPVIPEKVDRVVPPFSMLWRYARASVRSGIIGTVIGAIPGAGGNIAAFVAYDVGKRRARPEEREKFGKGSYEGIVCGEVANNACIGGTILPTLTLGIPGSPPAAAFMAALELKHVVMGPTINIENPGLVYFIYGALIVANFLMYVFGLLLVKPAVKLYSLPRTLLMPIIIPICILGAYAVRLSMFDVYVMLAAGGVGYALRSLGLPLAPMVLAVILGSLADENLRRALITFENKPFWYFLTSPVGTILMVVSVFTFYDGIFRRGRGKKT